MRKRERKELKRLKVLEKKHQLLQEQAEKAMTNVIQKDKIIQDRISEIKKSETERSRSIHQIIESKQLDARKRVEYLEQEEEKYVEALHDLIQTKMQKIEDFQKERVTLYEKQINERLESDLRKRKFANVVKEITRASNGLAKLEKLGVNTASPDNLDINALIEKLSSPNVLNHELVDNPLAATYIQSSKSSPHRKHESHFSLNEGQSPVKCNVPYNTMSQRYFHFINIFSVNLLLQSFHHRCFQFVFR